ncbi:TPA: type VI secretion system baseplate subunit TssK [Escherichia coli]|nr:type VI secretion system baseplate subunit TssK [Escherichia coli]HAY0013692.1 type VI secretion system baseplate subunit TssK [Escherichia coli]
MDGKNRAASSYLSPGNPPADKEQNDPLAQVFHNACSYNFFAMAELLHRLAKGEKGTPELSLRDDPAQETLRFSADASLAFPCSDISALKRDTSGAFRMTTTFMGLQGSQSPLPGYYLDHLAWKAVHEQSPVGDFLDMFSHRLTQFVWHIWRKYRYHISFRNGGVDAFSQRMYSLVGLGHRQLRDKLAINHSKMLAYSGILANPGRSPEIICGLVSHCFDLSEVTLQNWQRHQRFRAMNDLSWGFTELTLNNELLAQGKIMIDSASGTLPDGTVFSIPDQDALPDPLHPQHFPDERSRNIYLALPVASDVRNEISDGRRIGRYRLNYADVRDLHSEEGDARTLTLGQLTPRIMSGAEDMSAYITLPLCRISDRHADGSLTLDDDFIPSCQNIQVSKKLRVYLKEVQGAIGGRASDLANRIGSPAQSGIADVAEFMMLQLLNRNQTRFTHRARRSQLHPEDFYLDLAGLLGELMTFTELSRLPCPLDVYDHHDLTKTFKTLLPEVKRALHTVLSPRAVNLPLHLRDGIWQADIHDTELLQSATFVLAVAANMPVDQIQRQFIQQSKISSPEKIRNMVSVQIPGIPLRALMVAPRQLPYHSGFSYFELDKSGQAWTEMAAAGAVALHVSGSFPDLNMQLWAIRG